MRKIIKYIVLLSFLWNIIPVYVWAVKFQSPTNNPETEQCDGVATSEFGEQRPGYTHKGIDIARLGSKWPVRAAEDGTVDFVGWQDPKNAKIGAGFYIKITHKDGYTSYYMHLKADSAKVKPDNTVKAGDIIAIVGNTGDSKGLHLHFEIRKGGTPVDPRTEISQCLPDPGEGGKGGPGNDHPDESYDISDEKFPQVDVEGKSPVSNNIQIGVFNEGFSNAASQLVMDRSLCAISLFDSSTENLDNLIHDLKYFPVLVVPTAGFVGLDTSEIVKYKLRKYVSEGGVLISFAQQHGYEFSCLPGSEVSGYGWVEDQSCWTNAAYVDTYKPCFAGQSSANLDVNVDGYFTQWPNNATILLRRTKNQMPCMIMYPYGKGWVIASTLYSDWGYGHNHTSNAEINLIRDLISWVKDINKELPEFKPDDTVNLNVTITNNTNKYTNKVILTLIDPDRNIIATQTITTSIPPYQKTTIPYSPSPIPSSLGIWWVDYELQDNDGNIIQEQTEGGRFAVSEHLKFDLDWDWWLKLQK